MFRRQMHGFTAEAITAENCRMSPSAKQGHSRSQDAIFCWLTGAMSVICRFRRNSLRRADLIMLRWDIFTDPRLSSEIWRYLPGALEPIDRNDIGRHGYIRGNYRDGMVSLEFVPSAMRSYIPLTVTVTPDTAQFSLEEQISAQIAEEGRTIFFKIELHGFRDAQMNIDLHRIRELGNVIDVTDETQPDYDFDLLEEQYEGV